MKGVCKKLLENEEHFETHLVEQEKINGIIEIGKTMIEETFEQKQSKMEFTRVKLFQDSFGAAFVYD